MLCDVFSREGHFRERVNLARIRYLKKFEKTTNVHGRLVGALAYSCTNFPNAVCIFSLTFFQKAKARL